MFGRKAVFPLIFALCFSFLSVAYSRTLILYPGDYLIGESSPASMLKLLLYRFETKVDAVKFRDYKAGGIKGYSHVFIVSPDGVPKQIKVDIFKYKPITCVIGKIEGVSGVEFEGFVKGFVEIRYKGNRIPLSPRRMVYEYRAKGDVFAYAYLSDERKEVPYIIKKDNIFIVSVFALWGGENYVFADVLYKIYGRKPVKIPPRALVIIQDVNPYTDLKLLKSVVNYLFSKSIPFVISYHPLLYDYYKAEFVSFKDKPRLLAYLLLLQDKGIKFILSGCLNRYYKKEMERHAEFWDIVEDKPIDNFVEYFRRRMECALSLSVNEGIYPVAFEPSEFMFSPLYRKEIARYFKYYVGQVQVSSSSYKGTQTFPYITFDRDDGLTICPVNLGYVNKDNQERGANSVVGKAKILANVGDVFAVFLYHPFLGERYIDKIVRYLKRYGYDFVSLPFDADENPYYHMKFKTKVDFSSLYMKESIPETKKMAEKSMVVIYLLGSLAGGVLLMLFLYVFRKIKKNLFIGMFLLFIISFSVSSTSYAMDVAVVSEDEMRMVMLVNLLGHFDIDVKHYMVSDLTASEKEEIENSELLFFVSDDDGKIREDLMNIMLHRKKDFCFIGNDLYLLLNRGAYPVKYEGVRNSYGYVKYHGKLFFNSGKKLLFSAYTMKGGKKISVFTDGRNEAVYIGKIGNMWFVTNPSMYGNSVKGLVFADALHDIVGKKHTRILRALIRLEDVNPSYDIKILKRVLLYLKNNNLPFVIIFYLIYIDFASKRVVTLDDRPDLVELLKNIESYGGTLILHGVTHQYRKTEISGEGSEFWDIEYNKPIPNFSKYFKDRMGYAITVAKKYGLDFRGFEAPHYNLSLRGQRMLLKYFPVYVGQVMLNNRDCRETQSFPYFIHKSYTGLFIVPENLGYVKLGDEENSVLSILQGARLLKNIVRDPVAAFFFHPFVGLKYLKEIVEGMKEMNYNFVDLKNEIPSFKLPSVKPVSIEQIDLPFNVKSITSKGGRDMFFDLVVVILVVVMGLSFAYIYRLYRNKKSRWTG